MRDLFGTLPPEDPIAAARRGARPALRRRFYRTAAAISVPPQEGPAAYAVQLDGKPVRTPAQRLLAAPSLALATAIAAEWDAQQDVINPANMPLNRLANTIIDGVADARGPVAAEIRKYLASDLLFYRTQSPQPLRDREARHWDPILAWAAGAFGAQFAVGEGIVHVTQPEAALSGAGAAMPDDPWRVGAMHAITTLTGSTLIALAVARGHLSPEAAWQAAHVDEDWNEEQWGSDEIALQRRAFRLSEFHAAVLVLKMMPL
jgi:chaperone required for assembly of F1-ATPase